MHGVQKRPLTTLDLNKVKTKSPLQNQIHIWKLEAGTSFFWYHIMM